MSGRSITEALLELSLAFADRFMAAPIKIVLAKGDLDRFVAATAQEHGVRTPFALPGDTVQFVTPLGMILISEEAGAAPPAETSHSLALKTDEERALASRIAEEGVEELVLDQRGAALEFLIRDREGTKRWRSIPIQQGQDGLITALREALRTARLDHYKAPT